MMKIAIIGASGQAGRAITKEALTRGYQVTAIVRDKNKLTAEEKQTLPTIEKDLYHLTTEDLAPFDIVVDAFNAPIGQEEQHITTLEHLIRILHGLTTRLLVVGGAGSLYVDASKSLRLMDTPEFPAAYLPTASNMANGLALLQKATQIHWSYLSPAAFFDPTGAKTGKYHLAGDLFTVNKEGKSTISYADYAIALVDEMANNKFKQQRFSVYGD